MTPRSTPAPDVAPARPQYHPDGSGSIWDEGPRGAAGHLNLLEPQVPPRLQLGQFDQDGRDTVSHLPQSLGGEIATAEGYRRLETNIHTHVFRRSTAVGEGPDLCAVLQALPSRPRSETKAGKSTVGHLGGRQASKAEDSGVQQTVLVRVVKVSKRAEQTIPSLEWLRPIHDCPVFRVYAGEGPVPSPSLLGVEIVAAIGVEEELEPLPPLAIRGGQAGEVEDRVIEGGARVVDRVSSDQRQVRWWSRLESNPGALPPISVLLADDFVGLRIAEEADDLLIQKVQVFVCVTDFPQGSFEGYLHA